jgi:hypothetical protein
MKAKLIKLKHIRQRRCEICKLLSIRSECTLKIRKKPWCETVKSTDSLFLTVREQV